MIDGSHNIDLSSVVVGHVTSLLTSSRRKVIVGAGRMLLFMVEQVFLPMGRFGSS